jgi:hypothetical protein
MTPGATQAPAPLTRRVPWRGVMATILTLPLSLLALPACAPAAAASHSQGQPVGQPLVSDQLIAQIPASTVRQELNAARIEPGAPALGGGQVRYGITAYRVTYRTADALGRPTTATGIVAFPDGGGQSLRVVGYDHGTTADKADVPSSFGLDAAHDGIEGRWSAELFASAGFATAEPDYTGMGQGPGRPEYLTAKSEVSASLDLLDAAAQVAAGRGDRLDPGVLVTGFSQGGSAAMAVARAL